MVKDSSVPAQLSTYTDIFTKLEDGYYALAAWGYDRVESVKGTRLEVPAKEAVISVLSESDDAMSPSDVLKAVISKYGNLSTNKAVTVSSVLVDLHKQGLLTKLGTDRAPFYQLKVTSGQ